MSRAELRKRIAALEGAGDGSGAPRVLLILPDDGSGAPGFDGDGGDEAARQPRRRHCGGPELHIYGTAGCAFVDPRGVACAEDHGLRTDDAEQRS